MNHLLSCFLVTACIALFAACNPKPTENAESTEATQAQDTSATESTFVINSFGTDSTGIDSVWLVDNNTIILGTPVDANARKNRINEDEAVCLKKCKKADGSYDLDCILLCPVSKRFTFSIPAWKKAQ